MSTNNGSGVDKLALSPMFIATALAYDWVHNNIYWSEVATRVSGAKIEVLSVDTKWRHVVLNGSEVDNPRTLIVDPRSDQRYFSTHLSSASLLLSDLLIISQNLMTYLV